MTLHDSGRPAWSADSELPARYRAGAGPALVRRAGHRTDAHQAVDLRETAGLAFVPGVNEELAVSTVLGSQLKIPGHARPDPAPQHVWGTRWAA